MVQPHWPTFSWTCRNKRRQRTVTSIFFSPMPNTNSLSVFTQQPEIMRVLLLIRPLLHIPVLPCVMHYLVLAFHLLKCTFRTYMRVKSFAATRSFLTALWVSSAGLAFKVMN